jgi:hypothetical protein
MKILIACEFSGVVRDAFTKKGHNVTSCDLLPSDTPGNHYKGNVEDILDNQWDMMIAFPPCTYICNGSLNWLHREPGRYDKMLKSIEFVKKLLNADIPKIALENPIGKISTMVRKPNQIVRPWMFGHEYNKDICLWLKNLPDLKPTNHIDPPYKKLDFWSTKRNPEGRSLKSITFKGIAEAMAEQWG